MTHLAAIRTAQYVYGLDIGDFRRVAAVLRTGHTTHAAYVADLTDAERALYHALTRAKTYHMPQNGAQRANAGR